jgi:hypothetical protein
MGTKIKITPSYFPEYKDSDLGLFLDEDSKQLLDSLDKRQHKLLQAAVEQITLAMDDLKNAPGVDAINGTLKGIVNRLSSAEALGIKDKRASYNLVINMVGAVAASGLRGFLIKTLKES